MFISKEFQENNSMLPEQLKLLLNEFQDITGEELPTGLPLIRSIQHQIDLVPSAKRPNLPHHRMRTEEHEIVQGMVDELFQKHDVQESLSPCAVPTLLVPKKDGNW